MSKKRKAEIIKNLTNTIALEKAKKGGGNITLIEKLSNTLESVQNDTYVSKLRKKSKKK